MESSRLEARMQALAMVGIQCIYAGIALISKAAFLEGMKPPIFIVYRQATATLIIAPPAVWYRRRSSLSLWLGLKSFALIFAGAFMGVTVNQNAFFEGLNLSSATVASAMENVIPVATFVMAAVLGLEKVDLRSMRGMAKILGTLVCVGGTVSMTLLKGPRLLNSGEFVLTSKSLLEYLLMENWFLGCLLLFGSCWGWAFWLLLQVPLSRECPDHSYSTALTCFFGTIQTAIAALFLKREGHAWRTNSDLELGACLSAGVGSAVAFFGQAWIVTQRGPVFSAIFNPLSTVVATVFASIFLHEAIHFGSLLGTVAVITGLYMVLWGKAEDLERAKHKQEEALARIPACDYDPVERNHHHQVLADESPMALNKTGSLVDLQKPLLPHRTPDLEEP